MKSLGVIETRGLVAAVQAVDAACKSAGVSCIGYRKVGSGLVSVCFEGEISAIHTAIERGVAVSALIDPQVGEEAIPVAEHDTLCGPGGAIGLGDIEVQGVACRFMGVAVDHQAGLVLAHQLFDRLGGDIHQHQ